MLDSRGLVVGVAVASIQRGQNLNFAIPVSYVLGLLNQIGALKPLASAKDSAGAAPEHLSPSLETPIV